MSQEEYIKSLENTIESLQNQVNNLTEMVKLLTKKQFGRSSEKTKSEIDGQMTLFNEAEEEANEEEPDPTETTVRNYTRRLKGQKEKLLKDIPVEIVEYKLSGEGLRCPWCNALMRPIGKETVREELEFIPAKVRIKQYVRYSYECPECLKDGTPTIEKADVPAPVLKRSIASPSSVAYVIYQKYVNAVPLYRQEKDWQQYGIQLNRATLANWIIRCAADWLKPIYETLKSELKKRDILHADETPVQVLNEPGKKATTDSYMWLYRTGDDGKYPIILFDYKSSRSGENPAKYLEGFKGFLHTDGYAGYNKLNDITRCGCWAHLRRYFVEAIQSPAQKNKQISNAEKGRNYCNQLFNIERNLKDMSFDERKAERLKLEKPVLEAFWCWLDSLNPLNGSRLGKAVNYAKNQRPYMENYLLDGRCSLSNNLAENSIRPFTVGRKNWLFSASTKGAESSAIIYSLIETAKANNLNVYRYLQFILMAMPGLGKNPEPEMMAYVMPWAEKVIEQCRNK